MKKEITNQIGIALIVLAIAIYFGLKGIEIKIEVQTLTSEVIVNDNLTQKLYQEKLKEYQDWGYANGLVMAKRILGENKQLREMGLETEVLSCEKIVDDLYESGYQNAIQNPNY